MPFLPHKDLTMPALALAGTSVMVHASLCGNVSPPPGGLAGKGAFYLHLDLTSQAKFWLYHAQA